MRNPIRNHFDKEGKREIEIYIINQEEVLLELLVKNPHKKCKEKGDSLVAQWLRICLPMQGTRVWVLVWEDPTCRGATRPVSRNY